MKRTVILVSLITMSFSLFAQWNTDSYLNAGIGISNWGLPLYVSYESPFRSDINLGGGISYSTKTTGQNYLNNNVKWRHTALGLEGFGTYYADRVLDIPSDFDFYGGLGLGFYFWDTTLKNGPDGFNGSYSGTNGGFSLRAFVGGRYHLNSKMALNLELGGSNVISGGRFGLCWKM